MTGNTDTSDRYTADSNCIFSSARLSIPSIGRVRPEAVVLLPQPADAGALFQKTGKKKPHACCSGRKKKKKEEKQSLTQSQNVKKKKKQARRQAAGKRTTAGRLETKSGPGSPAPPFEAESGTRHGKIRIWDNVC